VAVVKHCTLKAAQHHTIIAGFYYEICKGYFTLARVLAVSTLGKSH